MLLFAGQSGLAQTMYPLPRVAPAPTSPLPLAVQPLSDADLLADQIRALTVNPLDLNALVRAGELALRLGDTTAAAAFFARAERIDPRNPRVKAGEGSLLVAAERPGEALRRFAEAEALGGDVRAVLADRGLAYDLIGQQERAQRDYRLALRGTPDDETQRRYALSLGISGKREQALAQIDPLLRRSDRGAWRARAFILAMGGDQVGAEKIAVSMMPGGMAQGLQPFFVILPTLPPVDRAFAVHFGEVRVTPERIADARLTPPLAALGPDPTAPVAVAAVVARPAAPSRDARKRRSRRVEIAVRSEPPPVRLAQLLATRAGPSRVAVGRGASTAAAPPLIPSATLPPAPARIVVATAVPALRTTAVAGPSAAAVPSHGPAVVPLPAPERAVIAAARLPLISTVTSPPLPPAEPILTVAVPPTASAPLTAAAATATAIPATPPARATPVRSEDSILTAILSDIKVPPSELEDTPLASAPATRPVPAAPDPALVARADAEHRLADQKQADQKRADDRAAAQRVADQQASDRDIAARKATDKKVADRKAAADRTLADRKAADARAKAEEMKAAEARRHDPKLLEPARFWVQVAGGATGHDLGKAWSATRGRSAALKGKAGYTTPLRATNRVLTGPFKTEGEAQAFVNTLARDGVSGFVFSSTAGQKIDKLPTE